METCINGRRPIFRGPGEILKTFGFSIHEFIINTSSGEFIFNTSSGEVIFNISSGEVWFNISSGEVIYNTSLGPYKGLYRRTDCFVSGLANHPETILILSSDQTLFR